MRAPIATAIGALGRSLRDARRYSQRRVAYAPREGVVTMSFAGRKLLGTPTMPGNSANERPTNMTISSRTTVVATRPQDVDGVWELLGDPVDTAVADAEIAAHAEAVACGDVVEESGYDDVDGFGGRGHLYPLLSPTAQSQLAASYQRSHRLSAAVASGLLTRVQARRAQRDVRSADRHLEYLLGSVFRLVREVVWKDAKRRLGSEWATAQLPELVAEATVVAVEAAASFDPVRDPLFSNHVASQVKRRVAELLEQDPYGVTVPRAWRRLGRIAQGVLPEVLSELGRSPSMDELRDILEQRCYRWAFQHLSGAEQTLPVDVRHELMRQRLSRTGMLSALRELPRVLASTESTLSLDASVGDDSDGVPLGELVDGGRLDRSYDRTAEQAAFATAVEVVCGGVGTQGREMLFERLGLTDGNAWTYKRIGENHGVIASDVARLVRISKARASAPHAQFVHLGGLSGVSFTVAPTKITTVAEAARALRSRVGTA